jgi:G6PDH family F420-dependent oxidoreductase
MMEEAVEVIRLLWQGGNQSFHGRYYTVENARLYDLPDTPPPIVVSATGPKAAEVAGRIGDGLWNTAPDAETLKAWRQAGGSGPRYGQVTVCWNEDRDKALKLAHKIWPTSGIPGELSQELPTPAHFEQAAKLVTPEQVAESVVVGPDPAEYLAKIDEYIKAGYDHVYLHQIGPDQQGFIDFAVREILPRYAGQRAKAA